MLSAQEVRKVEQLTIGQYKNPKWFEAKNNKISSTQIAKIVKRRKPITLDFVTKLRQRLDLSKIPAIAHGLRCESIALTKYAEQTGNIIREVGLYTSRTHPFIVASPDALFYDTTGEFLGVIEVKAPYSARHCTTEEALKKLRYIDNTGRLKKNTNYFFQVQAQMACSEVTICHFVIYTYRGIHIEKIPFDKNFWENKVLPALTDFHQTWKSTYDQKTPIVELSTPPTG